MVRIKKIYLAANEEQEEEIDRYRKDHELTRTAMLDEAVGEYLARRKGYRYTRTYTRVTGLKPDGFRRRSTDSQE